jgi:hypothetical protein
MIKILPIARLALIVPGISAFCIFGCSSISVQTDYDESAPFESYKTYIVEQPRPESGMRGQRNPWLTKEIIETIRPVLEERGLTRAEDRTEADLVVVFYGAARQQRDFVPPAYHVGRWGGVWRTGMGRVVRYKEGTLVIDMVDKGRKELVWQGVGKGVLNPDNPGETFTEAVRKVLESYPPKK